MLLKRLCELRFDTIDLACTTNWPIYVIQNEQQKFNTTTTAQSQSRKKKNGRNRLYCFITPLRGRSNCASKKQFTWNYTYDTEHITIRLNKKNTQPSKIFFLSYESEVPNRYSFFNFSHFLISIGDPFHLLLSLLLLFWSKHRLVFIAS